MGPELDGRRVKGLRGGVDTAGEPSPMLEPRTQPGAPSAPSPSHRLATAVLGAARALNVSAGLPKALADLAAEAARAVGADGGGVEVAGGTVPGDAIIVPLAWDDEVRGALWVRFPEAHDLAEDDMRVLEAMAELAV